MGIDTSSFNKERGKALIQLLMMVPEDQFDIGLYREEDQLSHECNSVGCMIGHATILDTKENLAKYTGEYMIQFTSWSLDFFIMQNVNDSTNLWNFLFSPYHGNEWNGPSIKHAIARINYVIHNNHLPSNWESQLTKDNLFYMPTKTTT